MESFPSRRSSFHSISPIPYPYPLLFTNFYETSSAWIFARNGIFLLYLLSLRISTLIPGNAESIGPFLKRRGSPCGRRRRVPLLDSACFRLNRFPSTPAKGERTSFRYLCLSRFELADLQGCVEVRARYRQQELTWCTTANEKRKRDMYPKSSQPSEQRMPSILITKLKARQKRKK